MHAKSQTQSCCAPWRMLLAVLLSIALIFSSTVWPAAFSPSQAHADTDTIVVAVDPGHGGSDPGAIGVNGVKEADANWKITQACVAELNTYAGVTVVLTQDNTVNLTRKDRVANAISNNADVVVSMHCNAVEGAPSACGSEVWIPNTSAYMYQETHVPGAALGTIILEKLEALGMANRGLKTRSSEEGTLYPEPGGLIDYLGINYYPRFSGVPGIIIEHGFVSNASDAAKLADDEWCKKMGIADAQAIAEYYGLVKKSEVEEDTENTGLGEAVVTELVSEYDPVIMGDSQVSAANMAAWYKSKNKTYPSDVYTEYGAATIDEFCQIVIEESAAEGVRAEIVFAQAMKETGWLQFGGQVEAEQCNFCGLGAVDSSTGTSADFSTYGEDGVRMGIRAQVQHLKAYASTDALVNECVDPRFKYVTRGVAPNVYDLAGKWATDVTYGEKLASLIAELLGSAGVELQEYTQSTEVRFSLADAPEGLASNPVAYVNGVQKEIEIDGNYATVDLEGEGPQSIVMYEMNTTDTSNPHAVYPVGMSTWLVSRSGDTCTVTRHYDLDDLLEYAGCSIRITGVKGIRLITGISQDVKKALTTNGLNGYTVVETGTVIAWTDRVEGESLTFDTPGASRGAAYTEGGSNPVYQTSGGVEYYTNVLVGFSTPEQYKRDLSMRPYVILEDAAGYQFVVYGGTVQRSIGYIAEQNANAFAPGTAAYNYIHGIIDACKE